MISLRKLLEDATALLEKDAEQLIASKVAKKLGLIYKGFGRWADPQTNKIVAKTIDGKLVKIEPEDPDAAPEYGKDSKYDSKIGMRKTASKLDRPSGQPFLDKSTSGRSNYQKTKSKIIQTLQKNKDRIDNDDALLAKATNLVIKTNVTDGVRSDDIDYIGTIAQEQGVEGLIRADQLIGDTYNTRSKSFEIEVENPKSGRFSNVSFDSLDELWKRVTWRNTPYGEVWELQPNIDRDYDGPVDSYRDSRYDN
jgi:hypothetical protein